jgi:hypothetical protein
MYAFVGLLAQEHECGAPDPNSCRSVLEQAFGCETSLSLSLRTLLPQPHCYSMAKLIIFPRKRPPEPLDTLAVIQKWRLASKERMVYGGQGSIYARQPGNGGRNDVIRSAQKAHVKRLQWSVLGFLRSR